MEENLKRRAENTVKKGARCVAVYFYIDSLISLLTVQETRRGEAPQDACLLRC